MDYYGSLQADDARVSGFLDGLKEQHDAGMHRAFRIFEFLAVADVASGLFAWNRNRQQSPEALARSIAAEYGL